MNVSLPIQLHPTRPTSNTMVKWTSEKQKETKHKEIEQNKTEQNFNVDINGVISLVKIWVKSFMHLLTKHKEILEQKESLVLPLLLIMSLNWLRNIVLMHLIN